MSTKQFSFSSSLCTLSTCLFIQTSADYQLICVDPVSYQSLVSWVEKQSRLVELNDVLLPSGSTTADLHFQATHSHQSGYCKLYLLCRNLHRPLQVSRNQGWDSSTSPGLKEPRMRFFYLLPSLTYRVPQYVLPTANSQKNPQFKIELCSLLRTQLMHPHKCCLTILSLLHIWVAYSRKRHIMA